MIDSFVLFAYAFAFFMIGVGVTNVFYHFKLKKEDEVLDKAAGTCEFCE